MCGQENRQVADVVKRAQVRDALRSSFDASIETRVERYMEIAHQGIVPAHHFAAASDQCIKLYRDGYFLSAVMVSQAVNEAVCRFILDRNGKGVPERPTQRFLREEVKKLAKDAVICQACADACKRIWDSFRNDVHHMNPKVAQIDVQALAKSNLQDLAVVEKEIFGCDLKDGKLVPHHPKYWDIQADGTVPAFLRLSF